VEIFPENSEHRSIALDAVLVKPPSGPNDSDGDHWVRIDRWIERCIKIATLIGAIWTLVHQFFRTARRQPV